MTNYVIGEYEVALNFKKNLGETAMHAGDIWLAKHFFLSSISACRRRRDDLEEEEQSVENDRQELRLKKTQAELHCLLAFLARETDETLGKKF